MRLSSSWREKQRVVEPEEIVEQHDQIPQQHCTYTGHKALRDCQQSQPQRCFIRNTYGRHMEETDAIQIERLLPPFQATAPVPVFGYPPMLNLEPDTFFAELIDQYLFAALYALLYTSLMAENRRRMQHLEGAIRRLEERMSELALRRNALRQEGITEEIEVILLSASAVQQHSNLSK